jgi:3-hydroxyisobutyrate dehydrogenase-like beta-hydroxyacid dehydrogenase
MKIGFVGLGNMGHPIAKNLLAAGHELTVWNRTPKKADDLVKAGARRAETPAEAAKGDLVITMVTGDDALTAVLFGEAGILSEPSHAIHISMSTVSKELVDSLAELHEEAGQGFVSAPVFGRPPAAEAKKLFVVAAGPSAQLKKCEPAFNAIAQKVFLLGESPSAANVMKLCGNFMILACVDSLAQALALGEKSGIAPKDVLSVLTGTIFDAPVFHNYGDILVNQKFRPAGFAAPIGLKDMNLVSAAAQEARVPMPFLGIIRDHLLQTIASEGEEIDGAALGLMVKRNAGLI